MEEVVSCKHKVGEERVMAEEETCKHMVVGMEICSNMVGIC
jgi:hypothetical protein